MSLVTHLANAHVPASVLEVVRVLQEKGYAAYLVGGCVRDLVRRQIPKDWDVATSAHPKDVQASFRRVIPTGIDHGTVTVMSSGHPVEVTTFRVEGKYEDGRRPSSVSFDADLTGDLSRRDFTINAMAFDPIRHEHVDPFGGAADVAAGIIRCVGRAEDRFSEDGLRALRAVRFAAVLGFTLDPDTRAAIPLTLEVFRKVSLERVQAELVKLLMSTRPTTGLDLLEESGLLGAVFPEAQDASGKKRAAVGQTPPVLEVRLAVWLMGVPNLRDALLRLKFPRKVAERVELLTREALPGGGGKWTDADLRRWFARAGPESVEDLLAVGLAQGVPGLTDLAERARRILATRPPLRSSDLALNGQDIMEALDVGPSPIVGEATRYLVNQVLEHPEQNTPDGLRALLQNFQSG